MFRTASLDHVGQPGLIAACERDRALEAGLRVGHSDYVLLTLATRVGASSRGNLLLEKNAYCPLGEFRLKSQVCNMKVSRATDCSKRPGADALGFKEILEKMQHFFLRPIAEVGRIGLAHSARRGCGLLDCVV